MTALDAILLDEYDKAGCATIRTTEADHTIFTRIPGVIAIQSKEIIEEDWSEVPKFVPKTQAKGTSSRKNSNSRVSPQPWA